MLAIIAAFWTKIDYRTRLMQPWKDLAKQQQTAQNNLLIDYISPNPFSTMVQSITKRHWPVTAVLIGSTVLKILIVFSTGLFLLRRASPPLHLPFNTAQQFELSRFNSSAVDDMAASLYAGVQLNKISYPPGTNASFAVETFNSSQTITGLYVHQVFPTFLTKP